MSVQDTTLPAGFETLQPFVAHWARPVAAERAQSRSASTAAERKAFYATAKDLLAPALAYLDAKPFAAFDGKDKNLMHLLLGFAHCAQAVEVQMDNEAEHAGLRQTLSIVRASADQN
jgi:hypothetical protein